jgi:HD-GYP domain-containing protein (c-di-GMP phosphodiesterase class II)
MNIRMDLLIRGIAIALDAVEGELLGATTNHGKRIAALSSAMGKKYGMNESECLILATCALLHDNALTEYLRAERGESGLRPHCEYGERNAAMLHLNPSPAGLILYHHERADGLGPFGKKTGQVPESAEIIAIADTVDVKFHLQRVNLGQLGEIYEYVKKNSGSRFAGRAANVFCETLDENMLDALKDENIVRTAGHLVPEWNVAATDSLIMGIAGFSIRIIDYKSKFTRKHTAQIACRAWVMAEHYGFDGTARCEFYLAAALHDIGKLMIPSAVLEKPGALDDNEFQVIKSHAYKTWEILKDIEGLGHICEWASNHHEKLDGTGYPFGKKADALDFPSRLIACLDIYQAVCEERPYHAGRGHADTIAIMKEMAAKGYIDGGIVNDLDTVMARYDGRDVPPPCV